MTLLDIIILMVLALGAILGFKRGIITQAVSLAGTILIIIIAFIFKGPLALFLCRVFPFFTFKGALAGLTVLNILVYEIIAFFILVAILLTIQQFLLFVSKILDRIIKMTFIFTLPSKLAGLVLGAIEYYILTFMVLYILSLPTFDFTFIKESTLRPKILADTPILNSYADKTVEAGEELISLKDKYQNESDKEKFNLEALDVLLKYNITTVESVDKLIDSGKLKINNIESILENYR